MKTVIVIGSVLLVGVIVITLSGEPQEVVRAQGTRPFPGTYVRRKLPRAIPTDPIVLARLGEIYGTDNTEWRLNFFLELSAHLNECAGGRVPPGSFYYWLHWRVEDRSLLIRDVEDASSHPAAPSRGNYSDDTKEAILDCVRSFVANRRRPIPPGFISPTYDQAVPATFPVTDHRLYADMGAN